MRDTFKYLIYEVSVRRRKDKSRRSYVSFGDVYSEIEACSSKLVISLSRVDILRIDIEDRLVMTFLSSLIIILHVQKVIQVARHKFCVITKYNMFLIWSYNN